MKRILNWSFFVLLLSLCFSSMAFAEDINILSGIEVKVSMDSEEDVDTYHFTTDRDDGDVYITLDEITGGFNLTLYDERGSIVTQGIEYRRGKPIKLNPILEEGTYTIKVKPYEWSRITSANYRLKATFPSPFTRNNSTFEPNDTLETSFPIKSGQYYKSDSDNEVDVDTYQFTTDRDDGDVYITLDEITGGFNLTLYDERGSIVTQGIEYRKGKPIKLNPELDKGTYYVKIKSYEWSGITSASYRLKVTYPSPFTRNFSTFEPNDTLETSLPIRRGQFYKSKNDNEIDIDTYQFTTNKNGEASITLDEITGGFNLTLYDERGSIVTQGIEYRSGKTIQLNPQLDKGTYYIKIKPYEWSRITSASYRLKANFSSSTNIYADLETNQHWSENIFWAMNKKLITDYKNVVNKKTGKKENLLKPYDKLTEAEFVKILSSYKKTKELAKVKPANKLITRGKMAEILVSSHSGKKVSEKDAIDFFIKNGITSTKTSKDFKPTAVVTRADVVTYMKNYDTFLNKPVK